MRYLSHTVQAEQHFRFMIHAPRQRNLASFDEAGLKVDKHGTSFVQNDGLGLGKFVEF